MSHTTRACPQAICVARKWLQADGQDLCCQPAFREGCAAPALRHPTHCSTHMCARRVHSHTISSGAGCQNSRWRSTSGAWMLTRSAPPLKTLCVPTLRFRICAGAVSRSMCLVRVFMRGEGAVAAVQAELIAKAATKRSALAGAVAARAREGAVACIVAKGADAVAAAASAICRARSYLEVRQNPRRRRRPSPSPPARPFVLRLLTRLSESLVDCRTTH